VILGVALAFCGGLALCDLNAAEGSAAQEPSQAQEAPLPLPKGKKLFLKDGSFQLVRVYERKGDRVRYYSVERSTWEEIPAELVDWEATGKSEAEDARRKQEAVEKIRATQAAERAADLDVGASIEVAPRVFLPENEGLYAVEGRTVVPLAQVTAEVKLDKGRLLTQVLVPVPVVPTRHRVQIAGKRAQLRLTTAQPEFYMRTMSPEAEGAADTRVARPAPDNDREPELELIRAQVKGDVRQIELFSTQITGQRTSQRKNISVQQWKVARGVYRLTLSQPLEPGEYALAEILPEGMNLLVWDFGVDPPAPQPGSSQHPPGEAKQKQ